MVTGTLVALPRIQRPVIRWHTYEVLRRHDELSDDQIEILFFEHYPHLNGKVSIQRSDKEERKVTVWFKYNMTDEASANCACHVLGENFVFEKIDCTEARLEEAYRNLILWGFIQKPCSKEYDFLEQ